MEEWLEEALDIVKQEGTSTDVARATGYWYAHIKGALLKETGFLGGSMFTMESTIEDLDENADWE